MKKPILILFFTLLFGGSLLAYYGQQRESALLFGCGLAAAGLGVIILGADTVIRRESIQEDDAGNITTYHGWSAILIGVAWVLSGLATSLIGMIVLFKQQKLSTDWLLEHPGLGLVAIGFFLLAYGGHELLGSEEEKGSCLAVLFSIPTRIFGGSLFLAGLTFLAAGGLEVLFPPVFQALVLAVQNWWKELPCLIQPAYCN